MKIQIQALDSSVSTLLHHEWSLSDYSGSYIQGARFILKYAWHINGIH